LKDLEPENLYLLFGAEGFPEHCQTGFCNNTDSGIPFISVEPESFYFAVPADSTFTVDLALSNALGSYDVYYDISLAHFARVPSGYSSNFNEDFSRNIETSYILNMTGSYIPIEPMNFRFYLIYHDIDGEGVHGITINFPPGFYELRRKVKFEGTATPEEKKKFKTTHVYAVSYPTVR